MLRPKQYHFLFCIFFYVLNLLGQEKEKAVPLNKIIIDIEQQHQVSFNYLEDNVVGIKLSPPNKALSLEQKLHYLSQNTDLSFENIDNKFINVYKNKDKTPIICGYLFSSSDKKPIEGANLNLSGKIHATTNSEGYFELEKTDKNSLLISHVGFCSKRISIGNADTKNCLKLFLEPEVTELKEIKAGSILASGISKNTDGSFEIKPKKFGILPGLIEPDALQAM